MRAPGGGATATFGRASGSPLYTNLLDLLVQTNNLDCGNLLFNSGALAIVGAGNTAAKTANTIDYCVGGVYATKAAATWAVLAGTILQNNFGGWVFTVDVAGTTASRFMNQGTTLALMTWPVIPASETVVGWVRLNPTTAAFIGGTTLLDAANTNAVYVNAPFGLGFLVTPLP
jgi:hypothetical protein